MSNAAAEQPPTRVSQELRKRIVGFGVWFVVGLAPFLGNLPVPLFHPLIDVYPEGLRWLLIPISGLLMGMTAVIVEFADSKKVAEPTLTRWFIGAVAAFVVSLVALVPSYLNLVTRVVGAAGDPPQPRVFAYVTGTPEVPHQPPGSPCKCLEGTPAAACIGGISVSEGNIAGCFGAQRIVNATILLAALYLMLTVSFAGAVGLQLLFERRTKEEAKRSSEGGAKPPSARKTGRK